MMVHGLISGLILSALALDLLVPAGVAVWLVYFVPLWAAARWYGTRGGHWVTAICAVLLVLGGLRFAAGYPPASELGRRALGAAVLWGTAFSIFRRRQSPGAVRRTRGRTPASGNADLAESAADASDKGVTAADEAFLRLLVLAADLQDRQPAAQAGLAGRQPLQARVRQAELQTRQLLACQEAERRRLARQLHDGIGQLLAAICMQLHLAKDLGGQSARSALDECLGVVEQAIDQVRELSLDLCPSMLDDFGLLAALRGYLDRQAERAGLTVNLLASSALGQLPSELETACFRITQEALANVIRHASAQQVQVELRRDAEALHLAIRDDGGGFDPQSVEQRTGGPQQLGLPAMRQRVALLGGRCRIESAPGRGTAIQVCLPLGDSLAAAIPLSSAKRWEDDAPGCDTDGVRVEVCPVSQSGRRP